MLERESLKAVIFDIDGTLVESFKVYHKVFNQGIAAYNAGPVPGNVLDTYLRGGNSLRQILERIFPPGTDDGTFDACRDLIRRLFREVEAHEVKAFPGIEELFGHLRGQGVKVGIATGRVSTPEEEWVRFTRMGLSGFLDVIVTSKEVACRKPAPDVIIECARRLDVPIGACIAVGDTESDILAAKRAGAVAAFVRTGHEDADALKAVPDIVLERTSDLLALLKGG
ncbi:MAG: HAD family hydrolase [Syntrophorhabdales bacterium]|jgi:phosphoglycolate phosphatase